MHIANPIYDVVFKYMMDDYKVSKIVLSALLEMEVIELNPHYALELRNEGRKANKIRIFTSES